MRARRGGEHAARPGIDFVTAGELSQCCENGDHRLAPAAGKVMDQIHIDELRVEAVIGVYDWERELKQQLLLTIALGFDNRAAASAGTLDASHDYARICETLREWAAAWQGELLEAFAEDSCALLRERFGASDIDLRVDKPLAAQKLGCARVGVRVRRSFG
ncbi:MAG: dihydroneopterin aldolase [Xanthomonadales bacterium]|nr:dihydroneopterin aldolase [Xanthomonadales bacterium]